MLFCTLFPFLFFLNCTKLTCIQCGFCIGILLVSCPGVFEANCYDFTDEDFLLGDGGSFSGFSSGYSTISNDNLPSPALYLPPPSAEGASSTDAEQREGGGVSGWDDWRIAESEVTLGPIINSTEQETFFFFFFFFFFSFFFFLSSSSSSFSFFTGT